MSRKRHLIKHEPTAPMGLQQELQVLSNILRKCKDADEAIRLTKRMDAIRRQIKPPVKKAVGRPKKVKAVPEQVLSEKQWLTAMIREREGQRRRQAEPPMVEPSAVEQQAAQLRNRAEAERAKEEKVALDTPPIAITAPYSGDPKIDGATGSPKPCNGVVNQALIDIWGVINQDPEVDGVFGSVRQTNALLSRDPAPPAEPGRKWDYSSDGFGSIKRG